MSAEMSYAADRVLVHVRRDQDVPLRVQERVVGEAGLERADDA